MDIIVNDNVFDSRLESRSDSATNLFACLAPENMNDNHLQGTLNDTDANALNEQADDSDMLSNVETATNEDQCIEPSTNELVETGTENESHICSEPPITDNANEFIPTIIDIRGACNDSSDKLDNQQTLPGDSTEANVGSSENENDATCIMENDDDADIHTISDHEESSDCDKTSTKSNTVLNPNVVIKEEPRDDDVDNDCMLVDSDDITTTFTSEIEIKEERINDNNDNEVRCVETTSKIPLPIPIKIEANFETDQEVSASESPKQRKPGPSSSNKPLTDKSSSKNTSAKLFPSAYRCHLCNTSFQEYELLNEHMKLHRNNSLIERYNKSYGKQRKNSKYICRTCGKRLSTGQSLSQHMMIHNNEKPHVCPICKKDFRHLSNFKMHVQKHKEEEELRRKQREKQKHQTKVKAPPIPLPADRSVARSADFGRLVGPLFVKESLLKSSPNSNISRPMITPKTEYRRPFELKYPKPRHDNVKENLIYYKKMAPSTTTRSYDEKYSRARKFNDDIGDDVIPLKTFNNVENIVMNATKFIVKVDNLDPNILKKKIKTPDISIDKFASSVHKLISDRKRRIQLSPTSEGAKRLKLDDIENIIMDSGDTSSTTVPEDGDSNEADDNLDLPTYYDDDDDDIVIPGPASTGVGLPKQETLTTNELFELLNDDRDSKDVPSNHTSPIKTPTLVADDLVESIAAAAASEVKSPSPKSSNVIVLKSTPSPAKRITPLPSPVPPVVKEPPAVIPVSTPVTPPKQSRIDTPPRSGVSPSGSIKSIDLTNDTPPKEPPADKAIKLIADGDIDEDDVSVDKCDMYDNAFRNVALRRLTLIRKKAAQNGGKVENKYLLGPLFWRKAILKAQRNQLTREPAMSLNEAKLAYKRINAMKFGKQDTRRTNDPAKLQQRAEIKLQYILGKVKVMNDVSHLNLTGPLFWKRTLKLAGIHDPNDLKRLLTDEGLTINDVEFISTKATESSAVESTTTSTTTSTAEMNGDIMLIDDDDSNHSTIINNTTGVNSIDSQAPVPTRTTFAGLPSPLLVSASPEEAAKSPVALTGSDFLESIVIRNKTSQPITNGSHRSFADGILNDDLLKPKVVERAAPAPSTTSTPILTKSTPLSSVQVLKTTADSTKEPIRRPATKAESILYDSLTKPRHMTPSIPSTTTSRPSEQFDASSRTKPESCSLLGTLSQPPKSNSALSSGPIKRPTAITSLTNRSLLTSSTSWASGTTKKTPSRTTASTRDTKLTPVTNRLTPAPVAPTPSPAPEVVSLITSSTPAPTPTQISLVADSTSHQIEVPDSTTALEAGGNIILNVDSADFQLIADSKNENGQETNYVLVSDGNGGVQLIKENDFRLLEDAGAASNASHYIVNAGDENFGNFDLMSNATGANGEQLAYIQLDGENFTTLQFIQDAGVVLEDPITNDDVSGEDKQKLLTTGGEKNVTIGGTNYVIAADPTTDLNHIGKELSDFLHIDYGTLLKNDNQHQPT